jgi:hypothetical protein
VIFRKAKPSRTPSDVDSRRGRGRTPDDEPTWPGETAPAGGSDGRVQARERTHSGPFDADELEDGYDPAAAGRVDLGGLQIRPVPGSELRLQWDEATQTALSALLVIGDSALELRAFAAPRSTGLWDEIRREIAADATRRGGVVTEATGPFGPEIKVMVPGRNAEGQPITQASRILGVDGPRWFLRGTLIGRAATDPFAAAPLLAAMAHVVVVRGRAPMAPRDMIPLRFPNAQVSPTGQPG